MSAKLIVCEDDLENRGNQEVLIVQDTRTSEIIPYGKETLKTFSKLADLCKKIRRRMENDGFTIKNGILVKKEM